MGPEASEELGAPVEADQNHKDGGQSVSVLQETNQEDSFSYI